MPRFLSPEWVAAVNDSLSTVDADELAASGADLSLQAASGRFRVTQIVLGAPRPGSPHGGAGGPDAGVRTVLAVENGRIRVELEDPAAEPSPSDVEISLSYEDASALSRGELDPAEALASGRVRVRGDLSVLLAGQVLLQAAAGRLAGLRADTTY